MSQLNITRNIFLEKEELTRFQTFLVNDTISNIFLENTTAWGIVRSEFSGENLAFKVEVGTNSGTIKITEDSKAVDADHLLIYKEATDNIEVPEDGVYYWVKISQDYRTYEDGTCSLDADGNLTGSSTTFTDVLRGQSTEVPVKIKFYKEDDTLVNDQTYEVVDVLSDTSVLLTGSTSFTAETNLRYIVIGSTVIGETVTSQQLEGLYNYDSCNLELIEEEVEGEAPTTDFVEDYEFYLARVVNNSGTVTVEDERTDYWTFNIEGLSDKLSSSNNLSDVSDVELSRDNLNVYSKDEVYSTDYLDGIIGEEDTVRSYITTSLTSNITTLNLAVIRRGKFVVITGTFTTDGNNFTVATGVATLISGEQVPARIYGGAFGDSSVTAKLYIYNDDDDIKLYITGDTTTVDSYYLNMAFMIE
jgi:hypothetical protein